MQLAMPLPLGLGRLQGPARIRRPCAEPPPPCRFYIHCDGALFGMMMPFIKQAPMVGLRCMPACQLCADARPCAEPPPSAAGSRDCAGASAHCLGAQAAPGAEPGAAPCPAAPQVTFKKPIGSVSVSGHKFMGAPVPCGVVITRFK